LKNTHALMEGNVMIDDVPDMVPPLVAATRTVTPPPDSPPPGESNSPLPTIEQQAVADHVFTDPHPAATLLGVLTSAMLLRDVVVDTFATSGESDEAEEKPTQDKPPHGKGQAS